MSILIPFCIAATRYQNPTAAEGEPRPEVGETGAQIGETRAHVGKARARIDEDEV